MNSDFIYMMYLAGCGTQAIPPDPPAEYIQWERVLRYAFEQSVDDLVSYAITLSDFHVPGHVREISRQKVRQNAVINTIRHMGILRVLEDCKKKGLKIAIIKGFAISEDYAFPEVRISADTDLHVSMDDEAETIQVFLANGFIHRERMPTDKDTHLYHPQFGHVELHIKLFEQFIYTIWHKGAETEPREELVEKTTKDGTYYTLGTTDHLLFVILHMMKHFIVEGCSLKMLLDISAILRAHDAEIDYKRIQSTLETLKYTRAIQLFLRILCVYNVMDLSRNPLACSAMTNADEVVMEILEDMESGGTRGFKDESNARVDGMRIYNAAILKGQKSALRYRIYLFNDCTSKIVHAVFPLRELMAQRYVYLKERPWLYPVACIYRIGRLIKTYLWHKDKSIPEMRMAIDENKSISYAGKKRARMFRNMNMIS